MNATGTECTFHVTCGHQSTGAMGLNECVPKEAEYDRAWDMWPRSFLVVCYFFRFTLSEVPNDW